MTSALENGLVTLRQGQLRSRCSIQRSFLPGLAVLIPESALDPASLSEHILAILTTPGAAAKMRDNALAQGIPDATERLVALVEQLAERKR